MEILRVVDLSHSISEKTQIYPGDPEPKLSIHSTIERDGFNLLNVQMGSQTGTHVDAPFHFDEKRERIDELPLERFIGRGLLIDVRGLQPRTEITLEMIQIQIARAQPGDIALIHTGWSTHFGTDEYFSHPYLSAKACQGLLDAGVLVIGIDAINIDETPDASHPGVGFPVHHLIAERAGVICENMTNLAEIDFADPVISLLPIKLQSADGAPVRAVAMQVR